MPVSVLFVCLLVCYLCVCLCAVCVSVCVLFVCQYGYLRLTFSLRLCFAQSSSVLAVSDIHDAKLDLHWHN